MSARALWLRPLVMRPARALATVAGVAVGVASVVSTGLASRAAVASLTDDVRALSAGALLEVTRPGGVAPEVLGDLRELCGEVLAVPVIEGTALVERSGELARLLGVDLLLAHEEAPGSLATGAGAPESAREALLAGNGCLLSAGAARRLGVGAGDDLALVVHSRPVALEIAALFEPPRFASAWERVLLVDVALAQELLGRSRLDRIELWPRTEIAPDELAARAARLLPAGHGLAPPASRRAEGAALVRALSFNLTALAGVSVLVGAVLVGTTLATSVVERRGAIALLRSLGASRAQLAFGVWVEAGVVGLLGGAAGVALGSLGARAVLSDVRRSVASVAEEAVAGAVRLEPRWIAAGLALGCLTSLAAACLPLAEALRTPPVQGLRHELPARPGPRSWARRALALALLLAGAGASTRLPHPEGRPVWALLSAGLLLCTLLVLSGPLVELVGGVRARAIPLRLAQAALLGARRRAAWAAGAVGIALALAVSMTTLVGSFRRTVVEWTEESMRPDLFVRPLASETGAAVGRLDPEVVRRAEALFGAENVDPFHQTTARFRGERVTLAGASFDLNVREGGVPFVDGRDSRAVFRAALEERSAVVNEPFARRFGVGRGNSLELATAGGTIEREIAGVYRDFSAHTGRVVLDVGDYLALHPDEGPENLGIFLPPDADVERARAALASDLGGRFALEILDGAELRAEVLSAFERTFAVTTGLQLVASLVAGLAVVLVLAALVRERARELAIVRVLGGSRAQLAGMVVGEAVLLGVAGAAGGLVVGLLVGYVLVAVVNPQSFGWTLRFAPPASVLWTAGAVVPACLLAGLAPAWLALRVTPQETLRESS